jgi:hypothetical protein
MEKLEVARKAGRPRVHSTTAEKQKAYRRRCKLRAPRDPKPPKGSDPKAWNSYLVQVGLGAHKGPLHSGGNGSANLERLSGRLQERAQLCGPDHRDDWYLDELGDRRRVKPPGIGPSTDEPSTDSDE